MVAERLVNQENNTRRFEEISVGDEAELTRLLTPEDVDAFAHLTGDLNPLHLNEEFAKRTTFGKPVVYGMLSASFISTMIGMLLPGPGALWISQTIEFRHPAFIGDQLRVRGRVKQKSPANRVLVLEVEVTNQTEQILIAGESTVKMLEIKEDQSVTENGIINILITGGGRGIGAAAAVKLAKQDHAVIINYLNDSEAAQKLAAEIVSNGGRAIAVQGNVAEEKDVANLFRIAESELGGVHGVVHCAAPNSKLQPFEQLYWADIQQQLDVQVKGAFNCVKSALPRMISAKSGTFVFIGSIAADDVPPIHQADYVIAKAALAALTRSLAVEYGPKGIRANVVSPGMTETDRITQFSEKARMLARVQSPLRRLAKPEDIADVIVFLFSPAAKYISGENIRVAGGAVML
jgi:3-oxoacyl-[acyl-carrier protein] reductase